MKKILFLVAALFLFMAARAQDQKFVIFNEQAIITGIDISDYQRFTPTHQEVEQADKLARLYLVGAQIINYSDFFKQYYGLLNAKGQKIILILCFLSKPENNDWLTETWKGTDGFNIKAALNEGRCYDYNKPAQ